MEEWEELEERRGEERAEATRRVTLQRVPGSVRVNTRQPTGECNTNAGIVVTGISAGALGREDVSVQLAHPCKPLRDCLFTASLISLTQRESLPYLSEKQKSTFFFI